MPPAKPAEAPRRRLPPDARRQQIVEAARGLFAERPLGAVSTADVADAAGVARSLVHHYFGGIRALYLAVAAEAAAALARVRSAGPETPFEERTAHNIAAWLDAIEANRELWLAVAVNGVAAPDPEIRALVRASHADAVDRTLAANADVLRDTPTTRFAVQCFMYFTIEASRAWLVGERTREETERLLLIAGRQLMTASIPAVEAAAG